MSLIQNQTLLTKIRVALHTGQMQVHRSDARYQVVGCGRRWGKTFFAWLKILLGMILDPGPYGWIVPWYKELVPVTTVINEFYPRAMFGRMARQSIGGVPVYRYITLPNGASCMFHSADKEDSLRGLKYKGVALDEAPSIKRSRWEAEIAPSLMDYGGWALFIGSPKGRNWFYELYNRGQDRKANPMWESWSQSSYVNTKARGGYLDAKEIDIIRDQLPQLLQKQEIYAQFLEHEGTVFRNIDGMIAGSTGVRDPLLRYSVGVDVAKTQDFTVLTAMDQYGHIRGWERFQQLEWPFQKDKIVNFSKRYPGYVWVDSTGVGDYMYDELVRAGIRVRPYNFTTQSKKALVERLAMECDNGRFTIPPDLLVLINELKAFTYTISPSGNIIYSAPEGLHDDAVFSLALSVWGFKWTKPPGGARGRMKR